MPGIGLGIAVFATTALTAALATTSAQAVDRAPDSFVWIFSETDAQAQDSALALARGQAWPVIFGEDETIALRPTGGGVGDFWHTIGPGVGQSPKAASSIDGKVAGAGDDNAFVVGPTGGLTFLPPETDSVAFSPGGAVVYGSDFNNSVAGFSYPGNPAQLFDVAVSPFGDGGALAGDQFYSTLTGEFQSVSAGTGVGFAGDGRLTFDAQGRPHVIDAFANVFHFSTITGQWEATSLGDAIPVTADIAADSQGTVGAAFVNDNNDLIYRYWTNGAGWQTTVVDTNVEPNQVGLAFDHDDLPVISYSKDLSLWVAYDPIVTVPEPASLTLLAGLGLLSMTRRRRG